MNILCVGGGPGGLFFCIAAALADPRHRITLAERRAGCHDLRLGHRRVPGRRPPGRPAGRRAGDRSGRRPVSSSESSFPWSGQHVSLGGAPAGAPGRLGLLPEPAAARGRARRPGAGHGGPGRVRSRGDRPGAGRGRARPGRPGRRRRQPAPPQPGRAVRDRGAARRQRARLAELPDGARRLHLRLRADPGGLGLVLRLPLRTGREHRHRRVRTRDVGRARPRHPGRRRRRWPPCRGCSPGTSAVTRWRAGRTRPAAVPGRTSR